jgi:hypothetical protein
VGEGSGVRDAAAVAAATVAVAGTGVTVLGAVVGFSAAVAARLAWQALTNKAMSARQLMIIQNCFDMLFLLIQKMFRTCFIENGYAC